MSQVWNQGLQKCAPNARQELAHSVFHVHELQQGSESDNVHRVSVSNLQGNGKLNFGNFYLTAEVESTCTDFPFHFKGQ